MLTEGAWLDMPQGDCKNAEASDSQDDESEGGTR